MWWDPLKYISEKFEAAYNLFPQDKMQRKDPETRHRFPVCSQESFCTAKSGILSFAFVKQ